MFSLASNRSLRLLLDEKLTSRPFRQSQLQSYSVKQRRAGCGPPALQKLLRHNGGPTERSAFKLREREATGVACTMPCRASSLRLRCRPATRGLSRIADRPLSDRPFRRSGGDPPAIGDRPFLWLGKATGVRCDDGDHVATFAATPAIVRHAGTRRLATDAAPRRGSRLSLR